MPPKSVHSKVDIIKSAFDLIRQRGYRAFSIRNVADRINSSSQPIYSFFSNKEDLLEETANYASDYLLDRILEYRETNVLALDMGLGYIQLMDKEHHLFRFLLNRGKIVYSPEKQAAYLKQDSLLKILPEKELTRLIKNICVFINGLLKTDADTGETTRNRELEMILAFRAFTLDSFNSIQAKRETLEEIYTRISNVYDMRRNRR